MKVARYYFTSTDIKQIPPSSIVTVQAARLPLGIGLQEQFRVASCTVISVVQWIAATGRLKCPEQLTLLTAWRQAECHSSDLSLAMLSTPWFYSSRPVATSNSFASLLRQAYRLMRELGMGSLTSLHIPMLLSPNPNSAPS
jgi:hypothetical protein